jgi:hypothetical protein
MATYLKIKQAYQVKCASPPYLILTGRRNVFWLKTINSLNQSVYFAQLRINERNLNINQNEFALI